MGGGGGGGGSSLSATAVVSTNFPLQSGYKALVAKATSTNYIISGTCSGTANITVSATSSSTFDGAFALSKTSTITGNYSNCSPTSFAETAVTYYDSNYVPVGSSSSSSFGKFLVVPSQLPASVNVTDTAEYGTETIYTDSTKSTLKGSNVISYVVESDGSSTSSAIVNLIVKNFNTSNQLLSTEQARYRIVADGTLSPVSRDVQFSTTSTTRLLFTAN